MVIAQFLIRGYRFPRESVGDSRRFPDETEKEHLID